ncbi:hypothetical protein SH668x_001803 [Planctomicrobium sp. SH668]|uniref:hypothetical protein n=1 Tax=Planctomicrobium sp. SH668 TaxID=3448126 RepID=UPI003F5B20D6
MVSLTTVFIATMLIALLMVLTTLSTTVIYALTMVLSWTADYLFDTRSPMQPRMSLHGKKAFH